MELKDFITETLKQIMLGVNEAQRHTAKIAEINPNKLQANGEEFVRTSEDMIQDVCFDVAVTVENRSENEVSGHAGLKGFLKVGGESTNGNTNTSVSRITFKVPVILPISPYK